MDHTQTVVGFSFDYDLRCNRPSDFASDFAAFAAVAALLTSVYLFQLVVLSKFATLVAKRCALMDVVVVDGWSQSHAIGAAFRCASNRCFVEECRRGERRQSLRLDGVWGVG